HLCEGARGHGGGNGDGVAGGVDGFFAAGVARVGGRGIDAPAAELAGEELFLVALVGGTAVADEEAALALDESAGAERGAGDADESVDLCPGSFQFADETAFGPAVEGEGVGVAERVAEPGEVEGRAAGEVLGHVQPGEGVDLFSAEALPLQACPWPGGVEEAQVASAIELTREFKVMEDAEDGLDDLHEFGGRWALGEFSKSNDTVLRGLVASAAHHHVPLPPL